MTRAAIRVPTTAVPTLVPTSWAVSLSAVPIEVRLLGIASTRATAQIVITVRRPMVITTMQTAIAAYPWSTPHDRPASEPARKPAPTRQAMRWPNRVASHSDSGRRGDHRDDDRQVGQAGPHRAPAVGVLEVQDQPEHHAGHRDRRADLRDGGAADGAVGEQVEVEHRRRRAALVPHERDGPRRSRRGSRRR